MGPGGNAARPRQGSARLSSRYRLAGLGIFFSFQLSAATHGYLLSEEVAVRTSSVVPHNG
jgi:hypothetical protein